MRRIGGLATLLAACMAPVALAAQSAQDRWQRVHGDETAEFFVDPATLERDGRSFTIMARAVFRSPQEGIASLNSRMLYDCAARTLVILYITQFRTDGSVAADGETSAADRTPEGVLDGSPNHSVMRRFCPPQD